MSTVLYDAPGPVGRRRILVAGVVAGAALLAVAVVVAVRLERQLSGRLPREAQQTQTIGTPGSGSVDVSG